MVITIKMLAKELSKMNGQRPIFNERLINSFGELIRQHLVANDVVRLNRICKFETKMRGARRGSDPNDPDHKLEFSAVRVIKVTMSNIVKKAVKNNY